MLDQDGNQVRHVVRYERPRVWSAVVFNAEQIDGLPPATNRPALPEWERHERAETILTRFDADDPPCARRSCILPAGRRHHHTAGARPVSLRRSAITPRRCMRLVTQPAIRRD